MDIAEEIRVDRERGAQRLEGEYRVGLMTLARRLCHDEGDAEALVNHTFAEVLESIDNYVEQSAFFAWMCRILVRRHAKDTRRKINGSIVCDPDAIDLAVDEAAEERIFREVDAGIARDAIEQLPEDIRKTLLLHYFMDIPVREIARILSVPSGTVKWRLHYARMILAAKLGATAKKPGVKALLLALALAALTAAGAATSLAVVRLLSPATAAPEQQAYDSKDAAAPSLATAPLREGGGGGAASSQTAPLREGGCRGATGGSTSTAAQDRTGGTEGTEGTGEVSAADAASVPSVALVPPVQSSFELYSSTTQTPQKETTMNTMTLRTLTASAAFAAAGSAAMAGTTYTWLTNPATQNWDAESINWKNASGQSVHWTDNSSDPNDAVFPSGSATTITIPSGPRYVRNVTVNAKHTFAGSGTGRLNVSGKFTLGASVTFTAGFTGDSIRIGGGKYLMDSNTGRGQQLLTYLEDEAAFGPGNDLAFGPVPASPSVNLVVSGGTPCLLVRTAYSPNRLIRIADGATLKLGNNQNPVLGSIRGTISGDPDATLGFSTNTVLETSNMGWGWKGTVVLDPGEGRTNDVGRLNATLNLKFSSGVTRLGTGIRAGVRGNAPFYVHGNSSYTSDFGNLIVDNAEIHVSQTGLFADAEYCAQVVVTNGGRINMPGVEWLHRDARLTVADGGSVTLDSLRLYGPASGDESVVELDNGGTIATRHIDIYAEEGRKGTVRFNGGRLQSAGGDGNFLRLRGSVSADEETYWSRMKFLICENGAVFDTSNFRDIYWSRPLSSGVAEGEADGGLAVVGSDAALATLVLTCTNSYSGPTVVSNATLQARVDYALPTNTTLRLLGGNRANFYASDFGSPARHTTNSLARVEGDGTLYSSSLLFVDGAVAPSCGGTLLFNQPCRLSGDFEIRGNAVSCGLLKVENGTQDLSALTIRPTSMETMSQSHGDYKIFEGIRSGEFSLPADFPADKWKIRYQEDGVYLVPVSPTVFIVR